MIENNQEAERRRIVLFGFSGSGKSTVANDLAAHYGLRVIHPSGIMRDIYEGKSEWDIDVNDTRHNTGFWESDEGMRLLKNRLDQNIPLDMAVDRMLMREYYRGDVVIDSWSLPWLIDRGTKIYLQANPEVRTRRVAKRNGISYERAQGIVETKDNNTRNLFKRIYCFDIRRDLGVFDRIIYTNRLSQEQVVEKIINGLERD